MTVDQGQTVRMIRTEVDVDEAAFGSEGELYLFGCLLNELIARHTPLNHVSQLLLRGYKNKKVTRWAPRLGVEKLTSSNS